jgi:hypothetical protein
MDMLRLSGWRNRHVGMITGIVQMEGRARGESTASDAHGLREMSILNETYGV